MAVPVNNLVQVQTYNESNLGLLLNRSPFISKMNTRYKNFQNEPGQLGATVLYEKPPRMTSVNSLVAAFQGVQQEFEALTIDKQISVSYAFTAQQFILNDQKSYMKKYGRSAMAEMGTKIEADVATECVRAPFRFFGDGQVQINSFLQLANMIALFRNFGADPTDTQCFLSDLVTPGIINSGQNQFTPDRNNANAMSWELGAFKQTEFYESNLLPIHNAGNVGINGTILTVTGVTLDANNAIIAITFSGAGVNDPNAVKLYDKIQFRDGVAGKPNMRFLTWIGHEASGSPVQMRATADAASDGGGNVTIPIYPPLQVAPTRDQNINNAITVGMQVSIMRSHRAGVIMSGNPFYLAMPQLPDQSPFATSNLIDTETGVSIRQTYGCAFGQNHMGMVHDAIWGKKLTPEYSMSILFPL